MIKLISSWQGKKLIRWDVLSCVKSFIKERSIMIHDISKCKVNTSFFQNLRLLGATAIEDKLQEVRTGWNGQSQSGKKHYSSDLMIICVIHLCLVHWIEFYLIPVLYLPILFQCIYMPCCSIGCSWNHLQSV